MAIHRGHHRADEGRPYLCVPMEEEVAGAVGETAVCHQGHQAAGAYILCWLPTTTYTNLFTP